MGTQDGGSSRGFCPLARPFVSLLAGSACPPHPRPSDAGASCRFLLCVACQITTRFPDFNNCHQVLGRKALGNLSLSEAENGGQPTPITCLLKNEVWKDERDPLLGQKGRAEEGGSAGT